MHERKGESEVIDVYPLLARNGGRIGLDLI
jgi:hypothetical protein